MCVIYYTKIKVLPVSAWIDRISSPLRGEVKERVIDR